MDYCSSCRRHLNGALVCPGCGAYAPDIAPTTSEGRTVPGPATTTGAVASWAPSQTWPGDGLHQEADDWLHSAAVDSAGRDSAAVDEARGAVKDAAQALSDALT